MKTNEFIKEVEALGFDTKTFLETGVNVRTKRGRDVLAIGRQSVYKIDCFYDAYDDLAPCTREKLFNLAVDYASTPIEERKEEKKYYIKLKGISGGLNYLNYDKDDGTSIIHNKGRSHIYETQFTKQEIKDYGLQKFVDSELFELVEVED